MTCVVYVDDCLFFAPNQKDIDALLEKIQALGMVFNVKNNTAGFLGVEMKRNVDDNTVTLTQTGLIDCIVTALGLDDNSNYCQSPAEVSPLGKDKDGKLGNKAFNYLSVIGMILYLSSHSRPDIQFA
eukprot:13836118-Ditylum_brightwellii.AAC.1